jgi:ankyrin repeat protein
MLLVACLSLMGGFSASAWAQTDKTVDFDKELEKTSQLIVMLKVGFSGTPEFGAGIIFGREKDRLLVATAYHVLHRSVEHPPVLVEMKSMPGKLLNATLLKYEAGTDLAVLSVEKQGINVCTLPFDRLGDVAQLKRAGAVSAVGNPNGVAWAMPVEPDKISQIATREIVFQSTFISRGHSGGGLLNENAALVGMVLADEPPFGRALKIDAIFHLVKQWGYPVTLQEKLVGDRTLLHAAAEKGDVAAIKNLLALCGDPNARDDTASTPLHWAAASGSTEGMLPLWKAGTDLNVVDDFGGTPLSWAVLEKKIESVRFLVKAGARVNTKDHRGYTPLHESAQRGPSEITRILILAGAEVNAINEDKRTPLHLALEASPDLRKSPFAEDKAQWLEIIKLLAEAGAKIEATALFDAVRFSNVEAVRVLVKAVPDLNAGIIKTYAELADDAGQTLLHAAARRGETEIVKILLNAGANVNSRGRYGETVLLLAIDNGNVETVKALVNAGADINAKAPDETPLQRARREGRAAIIKVLLEAGAVSTP